MADFLTDDQITEFFRLIKSSFVIGDIPTFVRAGAYEEITQRTETDWVADTEDATIYLDGRGDKFLYVPEEYLPILSMTSLTIINHELTETSVICDQTDDERQVAYDPYTGKIEVIEPLSGIEYGLDSDYGFFPAGVRNIRVVGKFGQSTPANILSLLQLMLMLRYMSRLQPKDYAGGDMRSERIGKYAYELFGVGSESKRLTMDDMINHLFDLLPFSIRYDSI